MGLAGLCALAGCGLPGGERGSSEDSPEANDTIEQQIDARQAAEDRQAMSEIEKSLREAERNAERFTRQAEQTERQVEKIQKQLQSGAGG